MKNLLNRRALALGLTVALLGLSTPVAAQSVSGSYRAEGRNPDGSAYSGTVQIREAQGQISMNWQVGSQSYAGSGTRNGDVVWVNWGDTHPVVYVRMPSGELHGTWANGRGLERLIP
ncbi:hypothetical protein RSK20926_04457 [Roseobacter sp. SK209-2-6]|uniref:LIC10280 family protein n=1 Tax=Roseobacter sp. SK209-2-6 TaxID=388739 RepID=UPI0000F3D06F|nr:hypothetical protein [Roseobacter sp. SK209-2-6]EBA15105.1 hypothetical protein RSK20926_04457 [Roseobacter sp. SK209-2-6]